jgi:PEP-CTERM motif
MVVVGFLVLACCIAPSAKADTLNLSVCSNITTSGAACPNTNSGETQLTYSDGVVSLTASGFVKGLANTPTNLYVKQGGSDETGLGIAADVNHEVNPGEFIDLNLSNLVAKNIFSGTLTLESLQAGEGFDVCEGHTVGQLGTLNCIKGGAGTGMDSITIHWTASNDIIGITAWNADGYHPAANLLIEGLTVTTPEPGTFALLGFGLAGLTRLRRRMIKTV